ncbi:hypothetical protein [Caballeronia sp. GAWG2-1]|uniref:hypothetical protein n=1 Tax=Caballeronia sp. GAWG2-1 TaxID=2921744 RepID=UPI00202904A9|nr:hypothetical protein [Caballeronia sp. GAWG2-1]
MSNTKCALSLAVSALFVSACATPVVNPNNLANEWSDRLRAYQINPVFPPREDLQVGDLYLLCDANSLSTANITPTGPTPQSLWIARLDLSKTLGDNYDTAIRMPGLTKDQAPKNNAFSNPNSIGTMPSLDGMVEKGRKFALRNVSLPEFFSTSLTSVQASALVPAGVVLAGLGLSSNDVASISINIPAAGSYGVPFMLGQFAVYDKIKSNLEPQFWPWVEGMKAYYAPQCGADASPILLAITEIYAAYAISVNFSFEKGAAARLSAKLNSPADSTRNATLLALTKAVSDAQTMQTKVAAATPAPAAAPALVPAPAAAAPAGAVPGAGTNAGTDEAAQQARLNNLLEMLTQQATGFEQQEFAGVSAQVISGSTSGIRVERVFSNPVVIGYKGVVVDQEGARVQAAAAQTNPGGNAVPNVAPQPNGALVPNVKTQPNTSQQDRAGGQHTNATHQPYPMHPFPLGPRPLQQYTPLPDNLQIDLIPPVSGSGTSDPVNPAQR